MICSAPRIAPNSPPSISILTKVGGKSEQRESSFSTFTTIVPASEMRESTPDDASEMCYAGSGSHGDLVNSDLFSNVRRES